MYKRQPHDAQTAIDFGAEGIGLTRTEHMFFEGDRIMKFRKMILAETVEERKAALAGIEPFQKDDFKGIYKAMGERPVTIIPIDYNIIVCRNNRWKGEREESINKRPHNHAVVYQVLFAPC